MATAPRLPDAPPEYSRQFMDQFSQVLRLFFEAGSNPQPVRATTFNIDMRTLPTQADLAGLRSGDVYVDTAAGHVLKIKP